MHLYDLHNHTIFSDGKDTVYDIARKYTRRNIKVGIADHYHMIDNLEYYFDVLKQYQIFKSVEIRGIDILNNQVNYDFINRLDYVIIEYLEIINSTKKLSSINNIFDIISLNIQKPIILAHPLKYNEEFLIRTCNEYNFVYELNLLQGQYDSETISTIKKHKVKTCVASDIHDLKNEFNFNLIKNVNMLSNTVGMFLI